MTALVLAMLLCLALGLGVVLAVVVPARRAGRDMLTPHGEHVVARVRERTESVASATRERTEGLLSTKDKGEVRGRD
ncbi:MAG: hypothetical protein IPM08_11600 [Actinomycetales bacterium]|nr:hypothetical protein [Actinomycetales bacterium]